MPKARVLLADDSVTVRRFLTELLNAEPSMEVVGTAANGRIALAKVPQVNPDIVILDVEMPELDGIETLRELRKTHPRLPVIMFSSLTERGAEATMRALALGAADYVTKPSQLAGATVNSIDHVRAQLVPKIRALCPDTGPVTDSPPRPQLAGSPATAQRRRLPPIEKVDALAIGCSTGGPNALSEVFSGLPAGYPHPIFITQHMPPVFTKALAHRLSTTSAIRVHEGERGQVVEPGQAYIAPGDYHMVLTRKGTNVVIDLNQAPPENSCRPAVDVMFRSVADVYGGRVLALIMTGMGQDGLRGCELLWERGAQIVVQDEASSVVWGMPGFVARGGLADAILPLRELAPEIVRRTGGLRRIAPMAAWGTTA